MMCVQSELKIKESQYVLGYATLILITMCKLVEVLCIY